MSCLSFTSSWVEPLVLFLFLRCPIRAELGARGLPPAEHPGGDPRERSGEGWGGPPHWCDRWVDNNGPRGGPWPFPTPPGRFLASGRGACPPPVCPSAYGGRRDGCSLVIVIVITVVLLGPVLPLPQIGRPPVREPIGRRGATTSLCHGRREEEEEPKQSAPRPHALADRASGGCQPPPPHLPPRLSWDPGHFSPAGGACDDGGGALSRRGPSSSSARPCCTGPIRDVGSGAGPRRVAEYDRRLVQRPGDGRTASRRVRRQYLRCVSGKAAARATEHIPRPITPARPLEAWEGTAPSRHWGTRARWADSGDLPPGK